MPMTLEYLNSILIRDFEVPEESIKRDSSIREDLGLDSLDAVDLTVILEDKTGIKVDPAMFMELKTLGDLHDALEKIIEKGAAS